MYERKEEKEKKYLRTFLKENPNEKLVNIVVIETYSRRRTSKGVLRKETFDLEKRLSFFVSYKETISLDSYKKSRIENQNV